MYCTQVKEAPPDLPNILRSLGINENAMSDPQKSHLYTTTDEFGGIDNVHEQLGLPLQPTPSPHPARPREGPSETSGVTPPVGEKASPANSISPCPLPRRSIRPPSFCPPNPPLDVDSSATLTTSLPPPPPQKSLPQLPPT